MMRFDPCQCPKCGEGPYRILATVETVSRLDPQEDGSFEFDDSAVSWETQAPLISDGNVTLYCRHHHGFASELVEEPGEQTIRPDVASSTSADILQTLRDLAAALELYPHWKPEMAGCLLGMVRTALAKATGGAS